VNYNSFFSFSESPFLEVLDQRFLFLSKQFELFLVQLTKFVSQCQGIAVLSGEEGVGKTLLVQTLLQRLPSSFQTLIISHPEAEPLAITVKIAQALGVTFRQSNLVNLTHLAEALQSAAQQEKIFFLVLDDAHALTDQHLEEIYVLSQMEDQGRQLLPILLVGRKGLVQKLAGQTNQRLQKLIRHQFGLTGLTFQETPQYIDHRLQQVGSSFKACFAEGCSGQLFSRTGGIPRRINQVCDQALNRAWQENRSRVTRDLIGEASTTDYKPLVPPPKYSSLTKFGSLAAAVLLSGLIGYVIYNNYYSLPLETSPPVASRAAPPAETLPGPRPEPSPVAPEAVTQVQPEVQPKDQTEAGTVARQEIPPPEPQVSQEPTPSPVSPPAEASMAPPQETPAVEAETTRPATHRVAPEDGGLLKIVADYYPDEQEIGYGAVILANPEIKNEDIIYPGQKLMLPKIENHTMITLNNHQHYCLYKLFYNSTQVEQTTAKLKEHDIHYLVRETWLPDAGHIYRIFLGGYEDKAKLEEAMVMAEKG
jgi:type II secretory pathway predicted ATPase ExeA